MTFVNLRRLKDSTVRGISAMKNHIQVDPEYQRTGAIWNPDRKRLLIDSMLRGYDVPKIYFREFVPMEQVDENTYKYAIIDGRQRLETIFDFLDDKFTIEAPTELEDNSGNLVSIGGMTFSTLYDNYADLSNRILNFPLDIVAIETDDTDIIEDMFLRLNEASPLNAAEKRNAFPGPIPSLARRVAAHSFFSNRIPYANTRYRHYDMATKFIYFEYRNGVADTKKLYLDRFVRRGPEIPNVANLAPKSEEVLDALDGLFEDNDPLLKSVGMASVYYLVLRQALDGLWANEISREMLLSFEDRLRENKKEARESESGGEYELNEFDRFSQSPNDAIALRFRRNVILGFLGHPIADMGEESV